MKRSCIFAGLTAWLCLVALGPSARAVSCPAGGATLDIVITNPNPVAISATVSISGAYIANELTCTSPGVSGSYAVSNIGLEPNEVKPITITNLLTGQWVHHIHGIEGDEYDQNQQAPIIYSTGTKTRVDWTYFRNAVKVDNFGDAPGGFNCPVANDCTLRKAIVLANSESGPTFPTLIWFSAPSATITMTQSAALEITGSNITIDGTDSNGNPWIVGDANAAAAGSQDAFPRVVDLNNNTTQFLISANDTTFKGLEIKNTLPSGNRQTKNLIWHNGKRYRTRPSQRHGNVPLADQAGECRSPPPAGGRLR